MNTEIVMAGEFNGDPVLTRVYYRSNGWSSLMVADVFVAGRLIETLVLA